jgi:hypothetical protein
MEEHHLDSIDILKIDIEGAEKEVFAARPAWLARIKMIAIELHDSKNIGCSRAFYTALDPYILSEYRRGENVIVTLSGHEQV